MHPYVQRRQARERIEIPEAIEEPLPPFISRDLRWEVLEIFSIEGRRGKKN